MKEIARSLMTTFDQKTMNSLKNILLWNTCTSRLLRTYTSVVCKDGIKVIDGIQALYGKVAKLVSHVRKSTIACELLEGENKPQPANGTRWNNPYKWL